jgi:hypothetical protein
MRFLLSLGFLLLSFAQVDAQDHQKQSIRGGQLVQYCKDMPTNASDPANDWEGMACVTYLLGFTNAHEMTSAIQDDGKSNSFKPLYCAPSGASIADYQAVIEAFAVTHPETQTEPVENFVMAAFMVSFPCPWFVEQAKRASGR